MKNEKANGRPSIRPAVALAVAAMSALIGFAAVYGTFGQPDNKSGSPQSATTNAALPSGSATASPLGGAAKGSLAAFVYKNPPGELAEVKFVDAKGEARTLSDFKGKTILLNLWATWCAPCREEMPSLDRLQQDLGSDKFEVVALAVDRGGVEAARKFLESINVTNLGLYVDQTGRSGPALKAVGMPTTILIGPDGREIGRLPGPAEWDSADAKRLVEAALQ